MILARFHLIFQTCDEMIHGCIIFLCYLPNLMSLEDYVLPGVTVLLKLLKEFIQLFLVAFGKLKCVEDLNGVRCHPIGEL